MGNKTIFYDETSVACFPSLVETSNLTHKFPSFKMALV